MPQRWRRAIFVMVTERITAGWGGTSVSLLSFGPVAFASIRYMVQPKSLPVRIPAELVERIDRLRGLVARERYVRHLLEKAVKAEERKQAKR